MFVEIEPFIRVVISIIFSSNFFSYSSNSKHISTYVFSACSNVILELENEVYKSIKFVFL